MKFTSSRAGALVIFPLLLIPVAFAATPAARTSSLPASGTWTDQQLVSLTESTRPDGLLIEQATIAGVISGSVSGAFIANSTVYVPSLAQAYYYAVDYCTCTIGGNGPYLITFNEVGTLTLSPQGYYVVASNATAGSARLPSYYISIQLAGTLDPVTDLSSGSYSGIYTYHA